MIPSRDPYAAPAWIPLSDPDIAQADLDALAAAACSTSLSHGPRAEAFEEVFAKYVGRRHAVAVGNGTAGLALALQAYGIGAGDEVIASACSWRETAHAIALAGATPVFADIDYWSGVLTPEKAEARVTRRTRAILGSNTNGHPAPWAELKDIALRKGLTLIEDSTEAIGSTYRGRMVGGFGDCSVFDFSQPGPLACGEGGMVATDDEDLARRKRVEGFYFRHVKSFEGIKDPYVDPDVGAAHWFLYLVHLGTRFTKSSCDAIVEDLRRERIDAHVFSRPLHTQRHYIDLDEANRRGRLPVTERLADRAIALPFHGHLTEEQVAFIVSTLKDASVNVGAGSAIYL